MAMKRVVCAVCGLTNLEKFVSFPHCAACGARLPPIQPAPWRAFWKRPVGTVYLALAIGGGLGALAIGVISIARETRQNTGKSLLVYSDIPRKLVPGAQATATFTLDSAEEAPEAAFEGVQLRLSRETLRDIAVVSLAPVPAQIESRGSGRYYIWDELPRGATVKLSFRPRSKQSVLRLHLALGATDYAPFELRSSVRVARPRVGQAPPKMSK